MNATLDLDPFAGLTVVGVEATTSAPPAREVSEPQERYVRDLLRKKAGLDEACVAAHVAAMTAAGAWTGGKEGGVSKEITRLLAMTDAPKPVVAPAAELKDGVYRTDDGMIVRVYHTVHGANQQVGAALRTWDNGDGTWGHELDYLGKAGLRGLTVEHHLPEEEARRLGMLYGFCVNCARELTRDESQYVGYGPTCAENNGWWYPSKAELRELTKTTEDPNQGGTGVPCDSDPAAMSRGQLLDALRASGYDGPTSYTKPKLVTLLSERRAS